MDNISVIVTSGGTNCAIDDVRFVSNLGTGLFGSQIAEAFLLQGCKVLYLHSEHAILPIYRDLKVRPGFDITTELQRIKGIYELYMPFLKNLEMVCAKDFDAYLEAVTSLSEGKQADIWVMCMAASDYKPVKQEGKLSSNLNELQINMVKCPKVIEVLRRNDPETFITGFKLSSNDSKEVFIANARKWLQKNGVNVCVANDLSGRKPNHREVYLVSNQQDRPTEFYSGSNVAPDLVKELLSRYQFQKMR